MGERATYSKQRAQSKSKCAATVDLALELGAFFLAIGLLLTVPRLALAQVDSDPVVEPQFNTSTVYEYKELPPDDLQGGGEKKKKVKFTGYTKQKDSFYNLCMRLYEDGRAHAVSKLAEAHKGGVVGCAACKSFFRLLFSQCKKVPKEYVELERKISTEERTLKTLGDKKAKSSLVKVSTVQEKDAEKKEGGEESGGEKPETLEEMRARLPKPEVEPRASVIDAAVRFSQMLFDDSSRMEEHHKAVLLLEEDLMNPEGKTQGEQSYFDILTTYLKAPFREYEEQKRRVDALEEQKQEQRRREFMLDSNRLFSDSKDLLN